MHTRPDRNALATARGRSTLRQVTTRSRVRCYAPFVIAGLCLTVAYSVTPIVSYILTIAALILFFEGALSLYERAGGRTGGIKDFRQ